MLYVTSLFFYLVYHIDHPRSSFLFYQQSARHTLGKSIITE